MLARGKHKANVQQRKEWVEAARKQLGLNTPGVQLNIVSATKPVVMCLFG